jgi:hypothetical protein
MKQDSETQSERVKYVYNAQFPAPTAVVLKYLVHNPHFTSRQGRQQGMDAMMAFYRPMAEEFHGELSVSEIQGMARHCVERLAKQIDELCERYRIANPMAKVAAPAIIGDLSPLAKVIEQGFLRMAESFQSGVSVVRATAVPNLDRGIEMDGSELGDLEQVLGRE